MEHVSFRWQLLRDFYGDTAGIGERGELMRECVFYDTPRDFFTRRSLCLSPWAPSRKRIYLRGLTSLVAIFEHGTNSQLALFVMPLAGASPSLARRLPFFSGHPARDAAAFQFCRKYA